MLRNPVLVIVLTCFFVGLMVFSFTPDLSSFVARQFLPKELRETNVTVAKYTMVKGQVWRRHYGRTRDSRLRRSGTIHHQDQITVERRSHLDLHFPSGVEIRLEEKTKAVVEFWNPADSNSPVYLNILIGDYSLLKKGQRGKLFVIQDRQLFSPTHRPKKKAFVLKLKSSELGLATGGSPDELMGDSPLPDGVSAELPPAEGTDGKAATLTNKYIEEIIARQKKNFQRCQANAIRDMGKVKGQVLVGFTIQPRGKIEEAKVLQSTIKNQQLMDCLVSVFKTCRFQEFTGTPIVRSYPLSFE